MKRLCKSLAITVLLCVSVIALASLTACKTNGIPKLEVTVSDGAAITVDSDIDDVKGMIVVSYTDSNGERRTVIDYELSGSLAEGETTLVVKYKDVTATFKITVTGKSEPSVKAELNGGKMTGQLTINEEGFIVAPADPVKENCVFEGWFKDSACTVTWNFDSDRVAGAVTLYAKFTQLFTVIFDANGGKLSGDKEQDSVNVKEGEKIALPAVPEREGYLFAAWRVDSEAGYEWNFDEDTVSKNVTLYAVWKIREVDVAFVLNYENAENAVIKSTENGKITYIPQREGYVFNGWWLSDGITSSGEYILSQKWDVEQTVTEKGLTLYAEWVEKSTVSSQLTAPSVNIDGNKLYWQAIDGAERYDVRVNKSGSDTELSKSSISETYYVFPSNYEAGYYTVKIRAVGDGINTVNSSYAVKVYAHLILAATSQIDFDISTSILTWTAVKNATAYEVRVDGVLAESTTQTIYDMSDFSAGEHKITVTAVRENYQSSSVDKTIVKKRLQSPDVKFYVDKSDNSYVLIWDKVKNADTYIITCGNQEISVTENIYRFNNNSKLWQGENAVTVKIAAYDSGADYLISLKPTEISVGKLYTLNVSGASDEDGSVVIDGETYSESVNLSQSFKITYNLNYAAAANVEKYVTSEQSLPYYVPVREGYVFNGWYKSTNLFDRDRFDFSQKIDKDVTLYAKWYKIEPNANVKSYVVVGPNTENADETGYLYFPYTVNTSGASSTKRIDIYFSAICEKNSNDRLSVSFAKNIYFSFADVTQNKQSPMRQQVYGGTNYYYAIDGINNGDVMRVSFTTDYGSVNFNVQFITPKVTCDWLSYYKSCGVSNGSDNIAVAYGSEITLKANTKAGHAWQGWYENDTLVSRETEYTFTMPAKNVNYSAKWTKAEVQANSEVGGTFTQLNGTYVFGEEVTLTSTTNEGYLWTGWYDGETLLSAEESYTFTIPDKDFTYTAKWKTDLKYIDADGELKTYDGADLEYLEKCGDKNLSHWYYVSGNVSTGTLSVNGEAHIILADGCKLSARQIEVPTGNALYVYAQSSGENAGRLSAQFVGGTIGTNGTNGENGNSSKTDGKIGVSGTNGGSSGVIVINGGVINVTKNIGGGSGGYGGGGGSAYSGSSGKGQNGLNGSDGGSSQKIVINGGVITAETIGGGNGGNGGFGGRGGQGYSYYGSGNGGAGGNGGNSGIIEINGGMVTANNIGAGIGGDGNTGYVGGNGGNGGNGGTVIIKEGCVTGTFASGTGGSVGKTYSTSPSDANKATAGANGQKATLYFAGSEAQWNADLISVENANVYFYSETEPADGGKYWHYDSDGNAVKW